MDNYDPDHYMELALIKPARTGAIRISGDRM